MGWPLAFGITLSVEMAVLYVFFRKEKTLWRLAATVLTCNLLTHPVVWFVFPRVFSSYGAYILVAESFALIVEIFVILWLLRPEPWYIAIAGSALANGSSYGVGLLCLYTLY